MSENPETEKCPECGCKELIIDHSRGELVCKRCGFVVEDEDMDRTPEWRAFTLQEKKELPRAGAPLTLTMHDKGLSTNISSGDRDSHGRKIKTSQKYKFRRLRKWNRRSKTSDHIHRNLSYALSYLTNLGDKLNLPKNVMETSSKIYRRALQKDLIRGRSIKEVASTCIYMACRKCKVVRSFNDIAVKTDLSVKELARTYRHLYWEMETDLPPSDLFKYISKFINKLELRGETERIASLLLEKASDAMLTVGRGPSGIAAACIYVGSHITGEIITQRNIASVANVTEVTIRNRYKELLKELDIEVAL